MPDLNHKEIIELIEDDHEADRDNREDALDDLKWLALQQWDQADLYEREGRPCLTLDKLNGIVNQVAGDIRQAQPGIEVFPVDSEDDRDTAEIYEGLIRQIEYQSRAQGVYSHGAESAVRCGIGHWRIDTAYTQDSVFEQEIKLKRILDPLSVIWDGNSVELDRSDAKHCVVTSMIHENEWKRRYKKESRDGISVDAGQSGLSWSRDKFIRIAEYWYLDPVKTTVFMMPDGAIYDLRDLDKLDPVQVMQMRAQAVAEREVDTFNVKRQMMDGQDFLGDAEDWAGRHIPIVPVVGSEIAFDGQIMRRGIIRGAKDAQRLYNYMRSAGAETIIKSPKAPWLVTPSMIEGLEGFWSSANKSDQPFLPYNADLQNPGLKPERQQPPTVPTALWQESVLAGDDVQATTGIYDASLGKRSNETSGKAIIARQREGDVGSFLYTDNFALAMGRTGQILVDLIPRIYDTQRTVRLLGNDESEKFAPINLTTISPDGEPIMVNDLSHGRFDVRVKVGQSHATARVEAKELMGQAMQANPQLFGVIGDLYFEMLDWNGSKAISERLKKMIGPDITGEDQEQDPQAVAQAQAQAQEQAEVTQLQKAITRLEAMSKQADIEKKDVEADKIRAETQNVQADTVLKLEQAETESEVNA